MNVQNECIFPLTKKNLKKFKKSISEGNIMCNNIKFNCGFDNAKMPVLREKDMS